MDTAAFPSSRDLASIYLSTLAADHIAAWGHPYDVTRDIGRAAVFLLDAGWVQPVPGPDGYRGLPGMSLCFDSGMWDAVREAAEAISTEHTRLRAA